MRASPTGKERYHSQNYNGTDSWFDLSDAACCMDQGSNARLSLSLSRAERSSPPQPKRCSMIDGRVCVTPRTDSPAGVLPESSAESVLEDLVAADRYRLLTMKRICQSMIRLSADNWLQVSTVEENLLLSDTIKRSS